MDNLVKKGSSERNTVEEVLYTNSSGTQTAFTVSLTDDISSYKGFEIEHWTWSNTSTLYTRYVSAEELNLTLAYPTAFHLDFGLIESGSGVLSRGIKLGDSTTLKICEGYTASGERSAACVIKTITGYKYA